MKRSGRYDTFVTTHNAFIIGDTDNGDRVGHRSPSFLPWHRRFLLQFERALQSVDPSVALPYWDWTADRTPAPRCGRPISSAAPDAPRRPGDGRAFASPTGHWPMNVRVDGRSYLRRDLGTAVRLLPTRAEVDSVLAMATYDIAPWNSASDGFRNHLEGWRGVNLHNRVHVWVGGQMGTGVSPNDPVFWLHHAYIDKLWADWQTAAPGLPLSPGRGHTQRGRPARHDEPVERRDPGGHAGPHAALHVRHGGLTRG